MTVYGFEIAAKRPGFDGRAVLRKEITAHEERDARFMIAGWLAVEGYDADGSEITLIADGCTFLEAGRREAVRLADALIARFGGTVEAHDDGDRHVVRVTLENGRGVSLKVGGPQTYDPPPAVEAFAFTGGTYGETAWDGEPVRNVTLEDVTAIMERLA